MATNRIMQETRSSLRAFSALLAAGILLLTGASATLGAGIFSLDVRSMPLTQVFEQVSDSTGYRITINEEYAEHPVTAKFNDLPLEKGLRQILRTFGRSNVAMVIDEDARKISVYIFKSTPSDRRGPTLAPPVLAPPPSAFGQAETPSMDSQPAEGLERVRPARPVRPNIKRPGKPLPGEEQESEESAGESPGEEESAEPDTRENVHPEEKSSAGDSEEAQSETRQ